MIVVFGSINVDLITPVPHLPSRGETVLGRDYAVVQGGKGANQALAAACGGGSGQRVAMVGTVGTDAWGGFALERLAAAGVDLSCVAHGRARTACGFISVDPYGQTLITVSPGANMETCASLLDRLTPPLARGDWLLLQMEVPIEENWRALRAAKAAGARTLLNLAPATPVDEAVLRELDILVVNECEAEMLGTHLQIGTRDHAGIAKALAARCGVLVTLGVRGSIAVEPTDVTWRTNVLQVSVADTTGAGDAYVGYLAAALDGGASLSKAMRFASVGASLSCEATGAQTAYRQRDEVLARVRDLP